MKINAPPWSAREFEVFLALADTLSFRRTAAQMHLSQSAVSGTVARLEESLGIALFERTTRSVQLTEAGRVFAEQARFLRHQMSETVRKVREVADLQVGRVSVAALPSLAATVVPRCFARFARLHPGVVLEVVDSLSGAAFDMVRAGRVDFALTAANPAYDDLDYSALGADVFVLLLPSHHALAAGQRPLRWVDVAELPHISMPPTTSVRQYVDAAFLAHRIRFAPRYEVEHLATIAGMVAEGMGVAALPGLAASVPRPAGIVQRRLGSPTLKRPIGLVTRRGKALSGAASRMVEFMREDMRHKSAHADG